MTNETRRKNQAKKFFRLLKHLRDSRVDELADLLHEAYTEGYLAGRYPTPKKEGGAYERYFQGR